jgi:hypothetical protein
VWVILGSLPAKIHSFGGWSGYYKYAISEMGFFMRLFLVCVSTLLVRIVSGSSCLQGFLY